MNRRATLSFLGAAGTVTGSRFLIRTDEAEALVDCGLFQGEKVWRRRNWEEFPADPRALSAVVLTHAHLDHCGYVPALVRNGFGGPVICTPETAALVAIVLRDAAHLQEEDAEHARRGGYSKHDPPLPLFDQADAEKAIALLEPHDRDEPVDLPGLGTATLHHAGHILGSAFVSLTMGDRRILISGDMGRPVHPLLNPPDDPTEADVVLVESTYGNRHHASLEGHPLAETIRRTAARGGVVLVPAFAVDRTPVLLNHLARLTRTGQIPRLPVYVDSPMALAALDVYRRAIEQGSSEVRPEVTAHPGLTSAEGGGSPLDPGDLHLAHSVAESMRLNDPDFPCIVISASGMATGGRVLHHLAHQLPDPRNTVVLSGFQVAGTRGRQLLDGAAAVKIHGRYVPVRADVVAAPEFSAHADADELVSWLGRSPRPPGPAFVVHGEPQASGALADRLTRELGWTAVVPRYQETVRLG
jgi:metallo-beta-lactamase family protein